ncbi:synemin [Amphiprion ocellaris]|uniref:IF rod domain-containing protein n=1 Tax=Amphiprion ocellaris TaxID=80972 RepID=A0A3Q1CBV3_AMPOC|nr:synemin [Amphiprion ocellaris]
MLPFKRTFETEKHQLQELNSRLAQYLSRTKQLEQENARLIAEINQLRQVRTADREHNYKAEMQDLRRMVGQLSLEKSQAEMEREKIWRELQMVQSLCSEQTDVCRDISGELKGCEKELQHAHKTNSELQQRLFQLENEYRRLEDAHRQETSQLRHQVESRVVPLITQTYRGPPVVSMEEVQEYARGLSQGWIETFDMYQQKVEEMEQSIKADQARLSDLQREKMLYACELDKMRKEAERQGQIQVRLEEQLMNMHEKFRVDFSEYQMIIEQLEHERNTMADTIEEKMRDHQHLLQVKMDLGMEVAAYRALLEGETIGLQDAQRRGTQHQRERIIEIKMPSQPYTPRASTLTTRQHMDIRYSPPTSSLGRSPVPLSGSRSPSRVIPISVAERTRHQSPTSRKDMISFNKARAAASATTTATSTKDTQMGQREKQMSQKTKAEDKTVKIKQVEKQISPIKSSAAETTSVKVVPPPMMTLEHTKTETEGKKHVSDEKEKGSDYDKSKDKERTESTIGPSEKKILDSVSVEEIIEKVIKPAGLEAKACSSGESKVRYHVEKMELEDGTTKTKIVLESKMEEELDVSEDSALDEILSQGVKKVSLEDIKDTATGSMITNLLSGLQGGENLENKTVNVEIIEEPVESYNDEELEVEQKSRSSFYEPSTYFQIEELDNVPHGNQKDDDDAMQSSMSGTDQSKGGYVQVQEVSRESESSHFSHDQDSHEYFVSTPDDNLSEPEEGGGITSYGHYGIVDDLSDERYYQDESLPQKRVTVEESEEYKLPSGARLFVKESFPECIIEEEVRVSPIVQESVLEFLREDSLEPKDQLKGALEKLQSSVSGPLREELAFLTKVSSESPQNVAVDVKKVQQSTDNGTMTIVAELNVSQSLEESGLLDAGDDLSEDQIMAALRSSNLGLEKAFQGGAGGGYSIRVVEEDDAHCGDFDVFGSEGESVSDITQRYVKLGQPEKSFSFQMDVQESHAEGTSEPELQSHILETPVKISQEKRVATIYLENPSED